MVKSDLGFRNLNYRKIVAFNSLGGSRGLRRGQWGRPSRNPRRARVYSVVLLLCQNFPNNESKWLHYVWVPCLIFSQNMYVFYQLCSRPYYTICYSEGKWRSILMWEGLKPETGCLWLFKNMYSIHFKNYFTILHHSHLILHIQ